MLNTELYATSVGYIKGSATRNVTGILNDCYRRFGSLSPQRVDVFLVDTVSNLRDLLKEESFRLGIPGNASTDSEDLVCTSDIRRGYPRISVCLERLDRLSKLAKSGALRHEAAHTILHGSLEYRIFRIPEESRQIALIKGLEISILEKAIHYLAAAVMDFEANKFLLEHDYIDCQAAFSIETIQSSDHNKSSWKTAGVDRESRFLYQISILKPVLSTHPVLSLPRSRKISLKRQVMLGRKIEEFVEYMETAEQNKLLQVANLIAERATQDTHRNVDAALDCAMSLA